MESLRAWQISKSFYFVLFIFRLLFQPEFDFLVLSQSLLNLSDSSTSKHRLEHIKLVGDVLFDFRETLEEAGEAVKLSYLHKMPVHEVRDRVKEIPKLIEDWKISYARTAAQTALIMVMSHHSEMEIWHVTKGIAEEDDEGNTQDIKAIQEYYAGYACRVAEMTNYTMPFFESVAVPPSPQELEASNAQSEIEGDAAVDSSAPPASSPPPTA